MKPILRFFIFLFSIHIFNVHGKIIRRYYFTGILFEDYHPDSKHIDFADSVAEDWKNLTDLAKDNGMKSKGIFCAQGEGAWIAYPKESFNHGSLQYQLIVGEHCVPADMINSIQPLGFVYGSKHTGLAHFKEPYFESEATLVENGTIQASIKSLIYLGNEPWTLTAQGRDGSLNLCIGRDPVFYKVCTLPDLVSQFGLKSADVSLKMGCDPKDDKLVDYFLQNCYEPGLHTVIIEFDLMVEPMKKVCSGGDTPNEKDKIANKFDAVMEIWKSRILYNAEEYGTIYKDNPDANYKVDFIMEVIDIFAQGCPRVSIRYLSILGNIFLMHLREVWKQDRTSIGKHDDDSWLQVTDFISNCEKSIASDGSDNKLSTQCRPRFNDPINTPNEFERLAYELMSQGDEFDIVIEQIWLILNFVSPYCSHVEGYHNNLWSDFPNLFKKHFLAPLEKQWMKPGDWQTFYPTMFNGFDIIDQQQGIVTCIQAVNRQTPLLDPVGRTSGFDGLFWQYNVTSIASRTEEDENKPKSNSKTNGTNKAGRTVKHKSGKKDAKEKDVKAEEKIVEKRKDKGAKGGVVAKRGRKMNKKGRKRGTKGGKDEKAASGGSLGGDSDATKASKRSKRREKKD